MLPGKTGQWESLIKPVKKAIKLSIGPNVLKFSELQTLMYEAANLVNERPVGSHPNHPNDGTYLCPNDMLLGRASRKVPSGPFKEVSCRRRLEFIQKLADSFWKKWSAYYFSSLVLRSKWHISKRNLMLNDIVLVKDNNALRGTWKIGKVSKTTPSSDGKVRRCEVSYKRTIPGMGFSKAFTTISRPVQDLVLLVACDE